MPSIRAELKTKPLGFTFDGSNTTLRDGDLLELATVWPQNIIKFCLKLQATLVGNEGIKHIADNLPKSITELELQVGNTQVGDDGLKHLASNLPKTLKKLTVHVHKLKLNR